MYKVVLRIIMDIMFGFYLIISAYLFFRLGINSVGVLGIMLFLFFLKVLV